jgi:hypothetical protein
LAPLEHKIADGDTLSNLAERYLGRADRYLEIYELNRPVLASPDLLPIGVTLKIPGQAPAPPLTGGAVLGAPQLAPISAGQTTPR